MTQNVFVALDCETTGFDSRTDKIIELGAVKFTLDAELGKFSELVNPGVRMPSVVARLTGIRDAELTPAKKFEEIRAEFAEFCGDAILIGHNLQFDLGFLKAHGLNLTHLPTFDTFDLANLILPRVESLSLENLAMKFQLTHTDAHRALSDAEATRDLFRMLIQLGGNFPTERWEKVRTLKTQKTFWLHQLTDLIKVTNLNSKMLVDLTGFEPAISHVSSERFDQPKLQAQELTSSESLQKRPAIGKPSLRDVRNIRSEDLADARYTSSLAKDIDQRQNKKIARTEQAILAATGEMSHSSRLLSNSILSNQSLQSQQQVADLKSKIENINSTALLETTATPSEILATVSELETPTFLALENQSAARKFATAHDLPLLFSAEHYVCREKLLEFSSRELTLAETIFAAKLLLHSAENFFELNLNRVERFLTEFVSAENCTHVDCPLTTLQKKVEAKKILATDHASIFNFQFSIFNQFPNHKLLILDAIKLPYNFTRSDTLLLDLPILEALVPEASTSVAIFWGLLGLLYRVAEAPYGRLDLATVTGSGNYEKLIATGKNLLESVREKLPPRVANALEKFLTADPAYSRGLRSNSLEEITLVLAPKSAPEKIRALAEKFPTTIFLDRALATSGENFDYARKQFGLPAETPGIFISPNISSDSLHLLPITNLPNPTDPKFATALNQYLLAILPTLTGISVVIFGNQNLLAQFFAKTENQFSFPILADRFSGNHASNLATLAESETAVYLTTNAHELPPRTQNLFLTRLPFFVRPDTDFLTDTLPAAVLEFKSLSRRFTCGVPANTPANFFILDRRIVANDYGKEFMESVKCVRSFNFD